MPARPPPLQARIADLGGIVLSGLPWDFGRQIVAETETWGKVVRFASIEAE
jgi:hypothetical protein